MKKNKEVEENIQEESHSKSQVSLLLKEYKKNHYNFTAQREFLISTGSLKLDIALGGGFRNGTSRLIGTSGSGKTSQALEMMRIFLRDNPNSKGFCVPAEGRLKSSMKKRSGIKFTENVEDWDVGTCFVFHSNVFEVVLTFIKELMSNNKEEIQYFFMVDSIDALILQNDLAKGFDDAVKVAGGPELMSLFFKHVGLVTERAGHHIALISQERVSSIQAGHGHAPPPKMKAAGGNAVRHYADIILQYEENYQKSFERETDKKDSDFFTNKIMSKECKVKIIKSMDETSDTTVTYPVRYHQKNGNSIWKEKEILEVGLYLGFITAPVQAKFQIHADVLKEMESQNIEIPNLLSHETKPKNEDSFLELLENNIPVRDYLYQMIRVSILEMYS